MSQTLVASTEAPAMIPGLDVATPVWFARTMAHSSVIRVVVSALIALGGCIGDLPIDDVPWACTRDSECGWRARCVDQICVLVDQLPEVDTPDAAEAGDAADTTTIGFLCEAPVAGMTPDGQAAFEITYRSADGRPMVHVTLDGLTAEFPLPPTVTLGSDTVGPLLECCEDPCCPPR